MKSNIVRVARNIAFAKAMVFATAVFTAGFIIETFASSAPLWQEMIDGLLGVALAYGAFIHVLCHYGFVARLSEKKSDGPVSSVEHGKEACFGALIPSYREEPEFVYRAMLSVALQRHSQKWLRLLVDDPPAPRTQDDHRLLEAARALPSRVRAFLLPLHEIAAAAAEKAVHDAAHAPVLLARAQAQLADRFEGLVVEWPDATADDRFFCDNVLRRLSKGCAEDALHAPHDPNLALRELMALEQRFRCDVATFERKRFVNLSHAANKAMNLNAAIDLIGRRLVQVGGPDGLHLVDDPNGACPFPETDYLLTLDADSLLAPDYAAYLLNVMAAPGSKRIGVIQTPYAALPQSATRLERLAGATTDVQRVLHQGFAHFDAAFWVGANAVLRIEALRDIAVQDLERGFAIRRFVQDRTPIEDTESTIDLAVQGWKIYNHNEIMAWSATPHDFGSLVIQRRRWACGGLIVLPKALRAAVVSDAPIGRRICQLAIRAHYLGSLFWCPFALLALMVGPFDPDLSGLLLPLVALPYFVVYALDLVLSRRPLGDMLGVYGLNLLLIPVNLAGALASVRQVLTGEKVPFARTPKVERRTAAPVGILAALWGGAIFLLASSAFDIWFSDLTNAAFSGLNGLALLIGIFVNIGWRVTGEDVLAGVAEMRQQRAQPPSYPIKPAVIANDIAPPSRSEHSGHHREAAWGGSHLLSRNKAGTGSPQPA